MLVTQSDVFDIPISLATVLTIRENNTYQRSLYFSNLTAADISMQIETSADGGTTWSLVEPAFTLSANTIEVREIEAANILRLRASGGGDDRDIYLAYSRIFKDSNREWVSPLV